MCRWCLFLFHTMLRCSGACLRRSSGTYLTMATANEAIELLGWASAKRQRLLYKEAHRLMQEKEEHQITSTIGSIDPPMQLQLPAERPCFSMNAAKAFFAAVVTNWLGRLMSCFRCNFARTFSLPLWVTAASLRSAFSALESSP